MLKSRPLLLRAAAASAALALLSWGGAVGEESPFAAGPPSTEGFDLRLADIMALVQLRHRKLWAAGKSANWRLASYEIWQLRTGLTNAALRYKGIPVEAVAAASQELDALDDAAKQRDPRKFTASFVALTTACNACHSAGGVDYIRIKMPAASPLRNEE
jgi:hypothetical protein